MSLHFNKATLKILPMKLCNIWYFLQKHILGRARGQGMDGFIGDKLIIGEAG